MQETETGGAVLQALLISRTQVRQTGGTLATILTEWRSSKSNLWLDVTAPDEALLAELEREFHVDTDSLLEVLDPHHKAHVQEYDEYFFMQLPIPNQPPEQHERRRAHFSTEELDLVCGKGFILTMHVQHQPTLHALWERYTRYADRKWNGHWPETLVYDICDAVHSAFYPHLEWLEDQHDYLERLIFAGLRSQIERVVFYKRRLHGIRRVIAPLRDAMAALSRRDFVMLDRKHRALFEQLVARSMRLLELVDNLRSLFDGLLNADLSFQNTRMNEVMKTLTIMATIMMPLTVLTGFFGMNFEHIPGLGSPTAFWGATGFMVVLALSLFWIFKRRGWW